MDDLKSKEVKITLEPEEKPWGVQAVFEDLYGISHVLRIPAPWPWAIRRRRLGLPVLATGAAGKDYLAALDQEV